MKKFIQQNLKKVQPQLRWIIYFSMVIYVIVSFLTLNSMAQNNPGYDPDTVFLLGVQTGGYNSFDNNPEPYNWNKHTPYVKDSLKMNSLSFFRNELLYGSEWEGGLYNNITQYQGYVNAFISYMNNNSLTGIYERGTFSSLCMAQRSTYQVEDTQHYGYRNHISPTGSYFTNDIFGVSGKYCDINVHQSGYIVSGLIENAEQSDNWTYAGAGPIDDSLWHVKPRMRIDSIDAYNHLSDTLAIIEIISYDTTFKKKIPITGFSFTGSQNTYSGKYLEDYFSTDLTVRGNTDSLNKGARTNFDSTYHFDDCKVDYRIWWTGVCNLWVDYVRLDDFWANELFKPNTSINPNRFVNKLKAEANAFKDKAYAFYVDEIRYNNLPAMKYVQSIIRDTVNSDAHITALYIPSIYNGLKRDPNLGIKRRLKLNTDYLDSVTPQFVMTDVYTLFTNGETETDPNKKCYFPQNLNAVNFTNLNYLKASSYSQYNNSLQKKLGDKTSNYDITDNLYNFSFIPAMNKVSKEAQLKGMRHIPVTQVSSFMQFDTITNQLGEGIREPTVEEINVFANLAICYGAKGLMYYSYGSSSSYKPRGGVSGLPLNIGGSTIIKNLGIVFQHPDSVFATPVHSNYYGQNKFAALRKLDEKLEKIGQVVKKLDWLDGFSVHKDGASNQFISEIKSLYRIPESPYNFASSNEDVVKYWEMGFFNPDNSEPNDKSKYFMMVNRRCVPEVSHDGDIRALKIKFDTTGLQGFINWKITDINTGYSLTFDKHNQGTSGFLNLGDSINSLGYFNPGEGKLFKLAPVMQKGGTLIADEDCGGEFDCKGEVNNNGKNVNLKAGTTINFTNNSARITMTGGNFKSGLLLRKAHLQSI